MAYARSLGVVSKALGWVLGSEPPRIENRVSQPFQTNRRTLPRSQLQQRTKFRFDPKDIRTRIQDEADMDEIDIVNEMARFMKGAIDISIKSVVHKVPDSQEAERSAPSFPAPDPIQSTNVVRARADSVEREGAPAIGEEAKKPVEEEVKSEEEEEGGNDNPSQGRTKFTLPRIRKSDAQLKAERRGWAAVWIQARWRGCACRRRLRLSRIVHRIFDPYFRESANPSPDNNRSWISDATNITFS